MKNGENRMKNMFYNIFGKILAYYFAAHAEIV